jgi:hypothetical protein
MRTLGKVMLFGWFDGPGINVLTPLTVNTSAVTIRSGSPGFRDVLCEQIAKIVAEVERRPNESLTITFEDGSALSISLRPNDYAGPEAYYAHGFKQNAWMAE